MKKVYEKIALWFLLFILICPLFFKIAYKIWIYKTNMWGYWYVMSYLLNKPNNIFVDLSKSGKLALLISTIFLNIAFIIILIILFLKFMKDTYENNEKK